MNEYERKWLKTIDFLIEICYYNVRNNHKHSKTFLVYYMEGDINAY